MSLPITTATGFDRVNSENSSICMQQLWRSEPGLQVLLKLTKANRHNWLLHAKGSWWYSECKLDARNLHYVPQAELLN